MKIRKGDIITVKVESLSFGGAGFAKHNGAAIFIDKALPGQDIKAFVYKKYKSYCKAKINEIITQTPYSLDARCPHFNDCGGCSFQNFDYSQQVKEKYNQVKDTLQHIGNFEVLKVNPVAKAKEQFNDESRWEELFKDLPFQRAAKAEEVADLTTFLVSPRCDYISGTIIAIDAGHANH